MYVCNDTLYVVFMSIESLTKMSMPMTTPTTSTAVTSNSKVVLDVQLEPEETTRNTGYHGDY
eukprot:scaffold26186_cov98-Skeletonema_marinoi.AAC.1